MARREGFVVDCSAVAKSRPPPNSVVPAITVEIRAYWPDGMGHEDEVIGMLESALAEAREKVAEKTRRMPEVESTGMLSSLRV